MSGLGTVGVTEQVQPVVGVGGCPVPSCRTPAGRGSRPAHPGPGGPCSTHGCRYGPRSPGRARTDRQESGVRMGIWVSSQRTHCIQPLLHEFHQRLSKDSMRRYSPGLMTGSNTDSIPLSETLVMRTEARGMLGKLDPGFLFSLEGHFCLLEPFLL